MIFEETKLAGVFIIKPVPNLDKRGYFNRTFCKKELAEHGIDFNIVQVNQSITYRRWAIRGLHFQKEPFAEAKIVQCLRGVVFDVVVDLRTNSPTYKQWISVELSEENKKMLYIPKNLAHGFQSLTSKCLLQYFMSEYYSPDHAIGVRWNDPAFNIKWPQVPSLLTKKDDNWPLISQNNANEVSNE